MSSIEHFATGGTIDSAWNATQDTAKIAQESTVAKYFDFLAQSQSGMQHISSTTLLMKDSRDISLNDRYLMAATLAEASARRQLVTSGTYLMPDVARSVVNHVMAQHFPHYDKRIVFTGALIPLDGYEMSDGSFNLGMATALLQRDKIPGGHTVLATMNGIAVPGNTLEKDMTTATFAGRNEADDILDYHQLTIIPAGGTIDFEEDGLDGLRPAADSAIPTYLRDQVRMTKHFQAGAPILKDSRALTDEDISTVIDMIRTTTDEHTIVTAGLIRMGELRTRIGQALNRRADRDRRVVLTGSRYMLRRAGMTDAPFNLGYAFGRLGDVGPGAHIAIAGQLVPVEQNPLELVYRAGEIEKIRN